MRYYDALGYIERGEIKKLRGAVLGGAKNTKLEIFRDYIRGNQWEKKITMTERTRSGRQVWKINSSDPKDLGVSEGDLSVWNVCSSTVDVYASYARGNINEKNIISIEDNEELADKINELVNLDILIPRTVARASVDSVTVWKYNGDTKGLDLVDSKEITPIYDGEDVVGTIRVYQISKDDPIAKGKISEKDKEAIYTEIWIPVGGEMNVIKYVNENEIENGTAPYNFNPYIIVPNKDGEFSSFDECNIDVSDVEKIIPIQDSINKTATEEGIIISKVAFPMIKVIKEVYEKIMDGTLDGEKVKDDLSKLSLVAGKIIAAPIEVESGVDIPTGIDTYMENLFNQLYRLTGIPKSVYVTEGLGNVASETLSTLMESLKRKIDEKRTYIERGIKQYVVFLTGDPSIADSVSIQWAEMFAMSKKEMADLVIAGKDIMPKEYNVEKLLGLTGDSDRKDEIMEMLGNGDVEFKIETEIQKAKQQAKMEADKQLEAKDKELGKEREMRIKNEIDKNMLTNELQTISSQL